MTQAADFIAAHLGFHESDVAAIIGNVSDFDARGLYAAVLFREPSLAFSQRLYAAGRLAPDITNFRDNRDRVDLLVRVLDRTDEHAPIRSTLPRNLIDDVPTGFRTEDSALPPPFEVFLRSSAAPPKSAECAIATGREYLNDAGASLAVEEYRKAAAFARLAYRCRPELVEALVLMAKGLLKEGRFDQAAREAARLFGVQENFQHKISLIQYAAESAAAGAIRVDNFYDLSDLLHRMNLTREQRFASLGWRVHVARIAEDWLAALDAIDRQLALSEDEERPGVLFGKAEILFQAGRVENAKGTIGELLRLVERRDSFFSQGHLLSTTMALADNDVETAFRDLKSAAEGDFDPQSFSRVAVNLSQIAWAAGTREKAFESLSWAAAKVQGNARSTIFIELGNRYLEISDKEKALAAYQKLSRRTNHSERGWKIRCNRSAETRSAGMAQVSSNREPAGTRIVDK
ncbi:MAG: tetratricopeptide repeat protein [Deltaproteobacteria bacterium]|nr:tetratricopeptide repeat protein [Deltaproteobacteria bacterium]